MWSEFQLFLWQGGREIHQLCTPRLMKTALHGKSKPNNHSLHLASVWWPCGTQICGIRALFSVLWAEVPIGISFGRVQITAYSSVPSPTHLSERTPKPLWLVPVILTLQLILFLGTCIRVIETSDNFHRLELDRQHQAWVLCGIARDVFSLEWYRMSSGTGPIVWTWVVPS